MSKKSARKDSAIPKPGRGIDEESVARISKRIWVIFAILIGLQIYTAIGMISARSQLESVMTALQQAETRVKQTDLKLADALVDKEQEQADRKAMLNEISAQGQIIEKSSKGEEKAEKQSAARDREIADLKARLARTRNARGKADVRVSKLMAEVAALKTEAGFARSREENIVAELERLKAIAEPYRAGTDEGRQQPR